MKNDDIPKIGDIVTGKMLWGDGNLVTGVVTKEDKGFSRDIVIVQINDNKACLMLAQTITKIIEKGGT